MAATRGVPDDGVAEIDYAYDLSDSLEDKVLALARRVYNAADVSWSAGARGQLRRFRELGWDALPVCMAKTHLSISDRPERKGRPSDYTFEVRDVRASIGAGFIYPIAGNIVTMPGLPGRPRSLDVGRGRGRGGSVASGSDISGRAPPVLVRCPRVPLPHRPLRAH